MKKKTKMKKNRMNRILNIKPIQMIMSTNSRMKKKKFYMEIMNRMQEQTRIHQMKNIQTTQQQHKHPVKDSVKAPESENQQRAWDYTGNSFKQTRHPKRNIPKKQRMS
eukprot:8942231-Ditylum_brightwellii.AAC.1